MPMTGISAKGQRALALAFSLLALAAAAQMTGGQHRQRSEGRDSQQMQDGEPQGSRPIRAPDPVFALERELPSLRTDLGLDAQQAALWGPFERSLRDAAEAARQRTKKLLAPRPADAPAPDAPGVISALADDDRTRADAMADAAGHLKVLYGSLTPAQRSLFDRRVLLSQSDPLGIR